MTSFDASIGAPVPISRFISFNFVTNACVATPRKTMQPVSGSYTTDVTDGGNFEGKSILNLQSTLESAAQELGLDRDEEVAYGNLGSRGDPRVAKEPAGGERHDRRGDDRPA